MLVFELSPWLLGSREFGGLGEEGVSLGVWLGEAEEGGVGSMDMPMAWCRDDIETTSAGSTCR